VHIIVNRAAWLILDELRRGGGTKYSPASVSSLVGRFTEYIDRKLVLNCLWDAKSAMFVLLDGSTGLASTHVEKE
jgi:hypothetical protein